MAISARKWYRVVDEMNPLCGCDVRGYGSPGDDGSQVASDLGYLAVTAIRRVDVFVGDRPFQRVAPEGYNLGLMVRRDQLEDSPLQDDVIELATTSPYGKCLRETQLSRGLSHRDKLSIISYENGYTQVALVTGESSFGRTLRGPCEELVERVTLMFECGDCDEEIVSALRDGGA